MTTARAHGALSGRTVLYIDTAYTLAEAREKKQESFFHAREASGFFERVWSVHPLADLTGEKRHSIDYTRLAANHLVIEGKVELFRMPRLFLPVNFLLSQWRLYGLLSRLMRRHDISMVMAADPFYSSLLGLALARRHRKPFGIRLGGNSDEIYQATGSLAMPRLFPSYSLQKFVQRLVLTRADLVTGINRNNLQFGVANGARKHTAIVPISSNIAAIHQVPPERRTSGKQVLRRLGVRSTGPMLLYLGRLLQLKHPDDAVRAMALNIKRHPGTVALIVGCGVMEPELKELAHELGVSQAIHFLGQLDQNTLSCIIPHCIMLSPSAGQMALLECALGGSPIVAYDRDFQQEFIDDGVNGFIVPFRDHEAMAEKVSAIIRDKDLAARLSQAARRKAIAQIDRGRVRQLEWGAFSKVLSGGVSISVDTQNSR